DDGTLTRRAGKRFQCGLCSGLSAPGKTTANRVQQEQLRLLNRPGRDRIRMHCADRARKQTNRALLCAVLCHVPSFAAQATMNYGRVRFSTRTQAMILLTNEDVEPLLKMPDCIDAIEAAFADLGNGDAVDIPRQDAIVPIGREGAVHDLKTMSGTWPKAGIAAIRLNSDIVTGAVVNGTSRRVKLALSEPGGRYNGQVLLFSTDTGQLLCIVNDGLMQRARVGATSGVAAKYLSRPNAKVLGLLGTGFQ